MAQETPEMTPQDGSLDSATSALTGLLSRSEEQETDEGTPEQPPKKEAKQVQPEPGESEIVDAKPEDETVDEEVPAPPRTLKVKVAGKDVEVTEEELLKGYSRTEDYTRKTQALAERQKAWEASDVAALRAEREQLQKLLEDFKPIVRPTEPKWEELKASLAPEQYAERLEQWRVQQNHLQTIEKTQAEIRTRQEADAAKGFEQYAKDQRALLEIELPAFKEPEKAKALMKDLVEYGLSRGFTEDDLSKVYDHRLVLLLNDAREGAKAKAKAPEIKNKIEKVLATSAPGNRGSTPKANRFNEANARLRNSGKLEDAADALLGLVEKAG